jgi:putative sterol carrier protein
MTDAAGQFFEELGTRGHEPALEKVRSTLRFDLARDGRTERWLVAVDRGDVAVSKRNAKADCVIRADGALFDRIATGQANILTALLRGAIAVEGDPDALVRFRRLFPGPQESQS